MRTVEEDGEAAAEADNHRAPPRLGLPQDGVRQPLGAARALHEAGDTRQKPGEENDLDVPLIIEGADDVFVNGAQKAAEGVISANTSGPDNTARFANLRIGVRAGGHTGVLSADEVATGLAADCRSCQCGHCRRASQLSCSACSDGATA